MTDDQRLEIMQHHLDALSEIYDSVQILGTFLRPNNTTSSHKRGSGNWYARQGMAHEFISENLAADQADLIAKKLDPPDDWNGTRK